MKNIEDLLSKEQSAKLGVVESKKLLRTAFLQKRGEDYKKAAEQDWGFVQFQKTLSMLGFKSLEELKLRYHIASYFPIRGELDLNFYVEPDWLFPVMAKNKQLLWFEYGDGHTNYIANKYGIKEKKSEFCFALKEEHLPLVCFVPGLAASVDGMRLGYGGGYYDRFVQEYKKDIITVCCLPSAEYVFAELPFAEHDQKVDFVCF